MSGGGGPGGPGEEVGVRQRSLHVIGPRPPEADGTPSVAPPRVLDRRSVIKLMAAAAAAPAVASCDVRTAKVTSEASGGSAAAGAARPGATNPLAAGTAWDPDLIAPVVPWEGVLTEDELSTLASLCDIIIPADERSPSASAVGAHDFIDEYVSAPYQGMERDLVMVRGGLVWLDGEAARRVGAGTRFRDLDQARKHAICDDICSSDEAGPRFRSAARFFDRVRDLTATAFYTTREGMADIGYMGNRPIVGPWPAPPPEALRHLGLEDLL